MEFIPTNQVRIGLEHLLSFILDDIAFIVRVKFFRKFS